MGRYSAALDCARMRRSKRGSPPSPMDTPDLRRVAMTMMDRNANLRAVPPLVTRYTHVQR